MRKQSRHLVFTPRAQSRSAFHRRHAHNYYVMGARRAEEGAHDDARRLLQLSLQYDPSLTPTLYAMAQLELTQGNAAQSHTYVDRILALCPHDADAYALLGNIALGERNPQLALEAFTRAETLGADTPELHFNTGLAHLALAQGEAAAQLFLTLLEQQPTNPRIWDALGCARCFLHDHQGAIQAFLQALQLDPQLNDARDHLAQLLLETGNVQRARQILESALAIEPHRPGSLHLLGVACIRQQQYPQAIAYWEELLDHGNASAETYHLLANAYLRQEDEARARETLESLVTLFPEHAAGHIQLALLLMDNEQLARGRRHLERARQLDPTNPALQQALQAAETLSAHQPPISD